MSDLILEDWANFLHAVRRVIGTENCNGQGVITALTFSSVVIARQDQSTFYERGATEMQMTDSEQCVASVEAQTAEGNPAALADAPVWSSADPSVVMVEPAPDGMTCVIKSPQPGPLGSSVVSVTAAVGGKMVSATLAVDIVAGDAVKLEIKTEPPTTV
jgi:hypothetical protein